MLSAKGMSSVSDQRFFMSTWYATQPKLISIPTYKNGHTMPKMLLGGAKNGLESEL